MEMIWVYALLSFLFFRVALKFLSPDRKRKLPPSPALALPVIGHLLRLKFPLHRTLEDLSQKLGPVFSLRMPNRLMVVVSSPAAVEECFNKNDIVLANRPRFIIAEYIGYNYSSIVSVPYGDRWRSLRRLATVEILSSARINAFQSIRQDEVRQVLRKIRRKSQEGFATVGLRPLLSDLTLNNIMRMVAGKRYFGMDDEDNDEANNFRKLKDELVRLAGVSNPADFFPVLRWIDFRGVEKKMARLSKELDGFLQRLIDEHKDKTANTMIDHLLSFKDTEPELYTDDVIKATILVMLLGGTDTSSVTMEWAMTLLLNHPDKMDKAQAEIDNLIGHNRLITESDISKLPYLQHVITETLRLFPAAPLLVPHEASADCEIGGYDIPRGSTLLVNAWAIHRDPAVWDDPTSFKPERFQDGEIIGRAKLVTFGMGRRACPGEALANRVVSLAVGSLIQCFEWKQIHGDMNEIKGASMHKALPLEALCKPRDQLREALARELPQ